MKTENDNSNDKTQAGDQSWLERRVNLVIAGLIIACLATLVSQLVYRPLFNEHHPAHFDVEKIFGFNAIFGFVAFVVIVYLGRFLRLFVKRDEDYYDS